MVPRALVGFTCLSLLFVGGCLRGSSGGRYPAETISIPDAAGQYSTAAQPDGAVGGKGIDELRARVAAALAERGEHAEADGALGATASFALKELNQGRALDLVALEAASRRFGFAGILISTSGFDMDHQDLWREQLDSTARNVPITRYGICMSPGGHTAAVVYGAAELEFEPISRTFEPGQSVTLKGQVASRFASSQLFLTEPNGKVDERRLASRTFEVSFPLNDAGRYQLEVMGDGTTGPVVLSNVPLYVGIPEPTVTSLAGTAVEPEQAEARMLELLNGARRKAGLNALAADAELRKIALAHSEDMVDHGFFGHVSPTTGTTDDRIRRSGALVSFAGENVAAAPTPEAAYESLMNSPGHRVNMLRPVFTHVGIGAEKSQGGITITLVFGRRPDLSAVPTTAAEVHSALAKLRAKQGLPEVPLDPVYAASAQAGADQYASGASPEDAGKAIESTLIREVTRLRSGRAGGCTLYVELLELSQLSELPPLLRPGIRKLGIGARTRRDDKGSRLSTVFLLEGAPCN